MDFLVTLVVLAIVLGLVYWLLTLLPIPEPFKQIVLVVFILFLVLWLLDAAGFFSLGFPHRHVLRVG